MQELLDAAGVRHEGVDVPGTLRMNIAVVEPDGTTTKVNEPGPVLDDTHVESLLAAIDRYAAGGGWVVGCGSLPPAPDPTCSPRSSSAPARSVRRSPSTPPARRCTPLSPRVQTSSSPTTRSSRNSSAIPCRRWAKSLSAKDLVAQGISTVVVSLGGDGAVLVDAEGVAHAGATISDRCPPSAPAIACWPVCSTCSPPVGPDARRWSPGCGGARQP